ncbi:MAG TPA: asparagine synthase (glutamine-hydrolyzing) [Pyrinomonadaceae bacterium]|nr:asparagine synthase (glutamine-hydrolyzing) [Pyrinomonadaceae bacterium]
MCGICGVWGGEGRNEVNAMVSALHHRGPDDSGVLEDKNVTLGMTRLAIIDTSHSGHQPMLSPDDQIAIVYNGELYNFREQRSLLEKIGYSFRSTSDTEVVLRMYEHYGDDFLLRMRGMFALAILDKRSGRDRLLLARDQLGIKPLLYTTVQGRFVFASEIKALLASGLIDPEIDPIALRLLLTHGAVVQPRSILRGVMMLPPAHRLIIQQGQEAIVERYWSLGLDRSADLRALSYNNQVETIRDALEESVRLQMVSDVPLGAFLSGGVDSSLLVAMMARAKSGNRLKTFSVGFEAEGKEIDETDYAEATARFLGTDHTRVIVRGEDVRDRINNIAFDLDQPTVDGFNSYFVSMAAHRHVTVAISGTGGDELFAGYPWFAQMAFEEQQRRAAPWKQAAKSLLTSVARKPVLDSFVPRRGGYRFGHWRDDAGFLARYYAANPMFEPPWTARLLARDLRSKAQAGRSTHYDLSPIDELPQGSTLERVTGVCLRGYTTNQLLRDIDAASMAHSLEVRVPFLDPVVADLALSLPDSAKLGGDNRSPSNSPRSYREAGTKRVLLDVAKDFLPAGFDTREKTGFSMPFNSWLKGPLHEVLLDTLSEQSVSKRGLLDAAAVADVRNSFLSGVVEWPQPWLLMMIELWAREVLDRSCVSLAHKHERQPHEVVSI